MAVYAVGDLQGCLDPLERLLEQVRFDPAVDRLWLVGDLVNRGPDSTGCLRFVRGLGPAAVTVLGNHDLHLLALRAGVRSPRPRDTLHEVLRHPDADELLDWLAARPLLHHDPDLAWTLVHAGIPPHWGLRQALTEAAAVGEILRDRAAREAFFERMYGNWPNLWSDRLTGPDRLRYAVNALTRMRFVAPDGALDLEESGPPGSAPAPLLPWFEARPRAMQGQAIVFGHWSALGYREGPDWLALDSGCVWGRRMTLVRLLAGGGVGGAWQQACG
jgi:bis(5'-nucleosyl)-tetraphosphatase (symmetrical)